MQSKQPFFDLTAISIKLNSISNEAIETYLPVHLTDDNFASLLNHTGELPAIEQLKSAFNLWQGIECARRLSILNEFNHSIGQNYPNVPLHQRTLIFCKIFLNELSPILAALSDA